MRRLTKVLIFLLLIQAFAAAGGLAAAGCGGSEQQSSVTVTTGPAVADEPSSPAAALQRLMSGNERFAADNLSAKDLGAGRRTELAGGQHPFAVVVTCSDSRVPPELIFDQGLGNIFVVRVAGNVIDADGLGSVEYAVEHLNTPLVLVMGHQDCGAVKASLSGQETPGSIGAIVDMITPAVDRSRLKGKQGEALLEDSIQENVQSSLGALRASPVLAERMEKHELMMVGSEYQLAAGTVELLP